MNYHMRLVGNDGKDYRIGVDYDSDEPCACVILADEKGYTVLWTGTPEEVGEVIDYLTNKQEEHQ